MVLWPGSSTASSRRAARLPSGLDAASAARCGAAAQRAGPNLPGVRSQSAAESTLPVRGARWTWPSCSASSTLCSTSSRPSGRCSRRSSRCRWCWSRLRRRRGRGLQQRRGAARRGAALGLGLALSLNLGSAAGSGCAALRRAAHPEPRGDRPRHRAQAHGRLARATPHHGARPVTPPRLPATSFPAQICACCDPASANVPPLGLRCCCASSSGA